MVFGNQSDSSATHDRATGVGVGLHVPAERAALVPHVLEALEAGDRLGRQRLDRAGRHQVHADALRPEVAGEVAARALERGLGHAHPVVGRPGLGAVVEVEPDDRAAAGHVRHHHVGERLERVGRDLERHRHVLPRRVDEAAAEARRRREADGVEGAVDPVPPLGRARRGRPSTCAGSVTSSSSTSAAVGQLAGGALRERQAPPGAGEDDLGALLLREAGDAERERGVGEDAGDEDALAVEEGHGPETATLTAAVTAGGRTPCIRDRAATVSPMRIGILGGTGPAGSALAARLASVGFETVIGSRSRYRALEVVDGLKAQWPGRELTIDAADNEGAADADLVVIATPWDGATQTAQPVEGHLRGKVVISMANALTRIGKEFQPLVPPRGLGGRQRPGGAARRAWWRPRFHHVPAKELGDLDHPIESDVLICSDHPEATRRHRRPRGQDPEHAARSTAASCRSPRRSSRSPPCSCS